MFSGLKNAVDSLAPPARRTASIDETRVDGAASPEVNTGSPVAPNTSWSGANIPSIANLSKLPFGVRSASPARPSSPRVGSPAPANREPQAGGGRQRLTLEDRLKARFALGDASPGDTPESYARNTPLPTGNPLSPTSTPLPDSPITSPFGNTLSLSRIDSAIDALSLGPKAESAPEPGLTQDQDPASTEGIPTEVPETIPDAEPESNTAQPDMGEPLRTVDPLSYALLDSKTPGQADGRPLAPPAPLEQSTEDSSSLGPAIKLIVDESSTVQSDIAAPSDPLGVFQPENSSIPKPEADDPSSSPEIEQSKDIPTRDPISSSNEDTESPELFLSPPAVGSLQGPIPEPLPEESAPSLAPSEPAIANKEAPPVAVTTFKEPSTADTLEELHIPPVSPLPEIEAGADLEALRDGLKLLETRFVDVSTAFKKLQADKMAADSVAKELLSVDTVHDANGLRDHVQSLNLKVEMSQDEVKRLTSKLARQEERLQELRDIHHTETKSQTELIDRLRREAEEAASFSKASSASISKAEQEASKHKQEVERLRADLTKATTLAKEEEEKRTKAISLLKTVRQKLVKTEKERDDAIKDAGAGRRKVEEELEKERVEKAQAQADVAKVNAERDSALAGMKSHFDREVAGLKDRQQKEVTAIKGQLELEAVTMRATFSKELSAKDGRISALEKSVQSLSQEKNTLFEQLQMRQAEYESSQSQMESMQGQTAELNYQLRESADRIALLTDELAEARREQHARSSSTTHSADDAARVLALTEARFEAKIAELQNRVHASERERNDGEAAWSRKLDEKTREVDDIRRRMEALVDVEGRHQASLSQIRQENERLHQDSLNQRKDMAELRMLADKAAEAESTAGEEAGQASAKITALEEQLEEIRSHEAQLKTSNKTLRDELRKVQSSVARFERQRAPGVGYWSASRTTSSNEVNGRTSLSSTDLNSPSSPRLDGTPLPNEEDVNLEYLRNVILQFLEHKEMRPNLVRVLSAILRFTPQETRRLVAKV